MKNLTIDCETELIGQGRKVPRMACMSASDGHAHELLSPDEGCDLLARWLRSSEGWLIGHNIAFDLAVVARHRPSLSADIWRLYDSGRVWDTGIHERLLALYHGWSEHPTIGRPIISQGVSLAQLAKGLLGLDLTDVKLDPKSPRYQYGDLIDVPLSQWSREAREYALEDARITHQIFERQQASLNGLKHEARGELRYLASFDLQVRAAWALHHLEIWGLRSSSVALDQWRQNIDHKRAALLLDLQSYGLVDAQGKRSMNAIRALIETAYGTHHAPRTASGQIQTANDVLTDSGEPILVKLAEYQEMAKLKSTFEPVLASATERPLNARWNVLVRTGRTSCIKPNLQNLPRRGGLRECFVPREGCVYIGADYSTAELIALAQVCLNLGYDSKMANAIKSGRDLHLALAADLMGISYERALELKNLGDEQIKEYRQLAKVPNFGLPGGLGSHGLVNFAKSSYGVELTEQKADDLKRAWFAKWPEMRAYFDHIKQRVEIGHIEQHYTHRRRGNIGFTDGANTYFQGLVADGAKTALYNVVRAAWMEPKSPLFGARPILFIHDEIICEVEERHAPAAADELARIMERSIKPFVPNLPISADAWVSRAWRKGLEGVRDGDGVLLIQD